jgi:hypothetical protein
MLFKQSSYRWQLFRKVLRVNNRRMDVMMSEAYFPLWIGQKAKNKYQRWIQSEDLYILQHTFIQQTCLDCGYCIKMYYIKQIIYCFIKPQIQRDRNVLFMWYKIPWLRGKHKVNIGTFIAWTHNATVDLDCGHYCLSMCLYPAASQMMVLLLWSVITTCVWNISLPRALYSAGKHCHNP